MKKILYFTFGILLFTLACEEDSVTTIINGTVKDYYSENAISNINLRVKDNTIDPTDPQLRQIKPYDTTSFVTKIVVDDFGNFDFETELLKKGKVYLLVYNDSDKFSIYKNEIEVGEKNNFNLRLKHYNILKVNLENSIAEVDSLTLSILVDNSNYDLTGEIVDLLFYENFSLTDNFNTIVFSKSIPDCLHKITCRYFKNGNFIDNVVIEKNVLNVDTTEILIEF